MMDVIFVVAFVLIIIDTFFIFLCTAALAKMVKELEKIRKVIKKVTEKLAVYELPDDATPLQ